MAEYRRYRAPSDDGGLLADPPWEEQPRLIAANRGWRESQSITWSGVPLVEIAARLRRECYDAIAEAEGRVDDFDVAAPLIASGHQPELFHPGVLVKNLALDRLAKASGGIGLHLVIDSDVCTSVSTPAPAGSIEQPRRVPIDYDGLAAAMPYEQRDVVDRQRFASFADRLSEVLQALVPNPLVAEVWPAAMQAIDRGGNLADGLSAARRAVQAGWDDRTVELPFSRICDTHAFHAFVAELVVRPERTRDAYNASLHDYRTAHRLRTPAQPLPDLSVTDDGFIETPFWVWSNQQPQRRALYARRDGDGVLLSDQSGWTASVPRNPDDALQSLQEPRDSGIKIRSRALATTLFCRWALADLFLHGIGGAKYDQVTDAWSERMLGAKPPTHATYSATLRLPIEGATAEQAEPAAVRQRLRQLRFHPENFVPRDLGDEAEALVAQKQQAVSVEKTPENAADRHQAIVAANAALAAILEPARARMKEELSDARDAVQTRRVLGSREYSFVMFPKSWLVERLTSLIPPND